MTNGLSTIKRFLPSPSRQLFELDQNLVDLDCFPWHYFYRFHLPRNRGDHTGFHLHGFQNHDQIVDLQWLSGLHTYARHDSSYRTAAYFRFISVPARRRASSRSGGQEYGLNRRRARRQILLAFDIGLDFIGLSRNRDLDLQGRPLSNLASFLYQPQSAEVIIGVLAG